MNPLAQYLASAPRGTASELARKLRVSRQIITDYKVGRTEPTISAAREIEAATDGAVPFAAWGQVAAE